MPNRTLTALTLLVLGWSFAFSGQTYGATGSATTTTLSEPNQEKPPSREPPVTVIKFPSGSVSPDDQAAAALTELAEKAPSIGYGTDEVIILGWSDKDFPPETGSLTTADRVLAEQRIDRVARMVRQAFIGAKIRSYNFGASVPWFSQLIQTDDYEVKQALAAASQAVPDRLRRSTNGDDQRIAAEAGDSVQIEQISAAGQAENNVRPDIFGRGEDQGNSAEALEQASRDDPTGNQAGGWSDESLQGSASSTGAGNVAGLKDDAKRLAKLGGPGRVIVITRQPTVVYNVFDDL